MDTKLYNFLIEAKKQTYANENVEKQLWKYNKVTKELLMGKLY